MSRSSAPPLARTRRRQEVLEGAGLGNGVDHVEVDPLDHRRLRVGLVAPMPDATAWGLVDRPDRVRITGGESRRGLRVVAVAVVDPFTLSVELDRPGDPSAYVLDLAAEELDPVLRRAGFSPMAACPSDQDCLPRCDEAVLDEAEPHLELLAKDYAGFRRFLLDLVAQRHPRQRDQHAADLGTTLLELLAAHADELSYAQDAVFAEAYLATARRRVSVRRHTRLVDHRLGEGRNAWAPLHVAVATPLTVRRGTRVLTRLTAPLTGSTSPAAPAVDELALERALAVADAGGRPLAGVEIMETTSTLTADPRGNALHVHHWGESDAALPPGATSAWLWAEDPASPSQAALPVLAAQDLLVLEQVRSPSTGVAADADPGERWLVRLQSVAATSDPAYQDTGTRGPDGVLRLTPRTASGQAPLPLLHVTWDRADAPDRSVCLRTTSAAGELVEDVVLGRGNVMLVDHGRTRADVGITPEGYAPADAGGPGTSALTPPLRLRLPSAPLTFQVGRLGEERPDVSGGVGDASPALLVRVTRTAGPQETYVPVADLLASGPDSPHVVVEVDDDGFALLRFGSDGLGRAPLDAASFSATFRTGNGTAGNVGADSLVHLALPAADAARVLAVRNPLAARDGTDPEPVERARRLAPDAYRTPQLRAVTPDDAVAALLRVPAVRAAVAALRWTGSWYTWVVGVLPSDPDDLVDVGTGQDLAAPLRAAATAAMDSVRLCGHDVDVRPPRFIAVELGLHVCAARDARRSEVAVRVRDALLAPARGGRPAGLLAGPALTFGRPLLLGDVYATVAAVPGVESVLATHLTRVGVPDGGQLAAGRLDVAPWEVLRLDDDPSLPGRGVLRLDVDGGLP